MLGGLDPLGRQALPQIGGVSGLSPGLASGRLFADGRRSLRWIGRRRHGRVGRVLCQPRLHVAQLGLDLTQELLGLGQFAFEPRDVGITLLTSKARREIHTFMLHYGLLPSCASLWG